MFIKEVIWRHRNDRWNIGKHVVQAYTNLCWDVDGGAWTQDAFAATPALAICIALIRALQRTGE